jgi:hypothetical protein
LRLRRPTLAHLLAAGPTAEQRREGVQRRCHGGRHGGLGTDLRDQVAGVCKRLTYSCVTVRYLS